MMAKKRKMKTMSLIRGPTKKTQKENHKVLKG